MFCRRTLFFYVLSTFLLLITPACRRRPKPAVERLAVIPFENLSSDPALNKTGRLVASALVYDLAPAPHLHAQIADSIAGALGRTSLALEGYFSKNGGRMILTAALEDISKTRTLDSFELSGPVAEGVLPLLNQLAKRLSPAARPFGTDKEAAFRDYGEALGIGDPQAMATVLQAATVADPHFAVAYISLARVQFAQGHRDEGLKTLQAARAANPDAIEAAEIDYIAASLTGETDKRVKALEVLSRAIPNDVAWVGELAALKVSERRFQEAAREYEAAIRLAPEDAELWNQLGYAYAYGQDLANARRALEHYAQMTAPANWNAFDSLGEVNFFLGEFQEAEKYFLKAQENNPARRGEELRRAAEARLLAGDLEGADATFQKYLALAQPAQQKAAGFEHAQWEFLTGRRKSGMARLEQLIPALDQDQQSLAWSQLSIWKMQTGAEGAATEMAEKAVKLAQSPRARNLSALCREIALARSNAGGTSAYALLFARKVWAARPLLEAIYRGTNPTLDGQIRTFLAWAEQETNHLADARPLVQTYPLPISSGDPVLASMVFPRFIFLRAVVLQNDGKRAEAKKSFELFLKYAGDVRDVFGENIVARKILAGY